MNCPTCGGFVAVMGALGRRTYGRCIGCGLDAVINIETDDHWRVDDEG
jgi:hypothetical protein